MKQILHQGNIYFHNSKSNFQIFDEQKAKIVFIHQYCLASKKMLDEQKKEQN